ncbi:MAG: hypothetical protein AB1489_11520 [Acidobacteriota bacterium]
MSKQSFNQQCQKLSLGEPIWLLLINGSKVGGLLEAYLPACERPGTISFRTTHGTTMVLSDWITNIEVCESICC